MNAISTSKDGYEGRNYLGTVVSCHVAGILKLTSTIIIASLQKEYELQNEYR